MVMGYGECGPGDIPIDRSFTERDSNLNDRAWTPPGSEAVMWAAIQAVLKSPQPPAALCSPGPLQLVSVAPCPLERLPIPYLVCSIESPP